MTMNTPDINETNGRIGWLDIAKGIAVALMIIGHTVDFGSLSRNMIFSFHMPLFFVLAGYTIKAAGTLRQEAKRIVGDAKRLLLPVLVVLVLEAATQILIYHESAAQVFKQALEKIAWGNGCDYTFLGVEITGIGAIWFLIALFFARILYRVLLRFFPDGYQRIPIVMLLMAIGILIGKHVWLPQNLDIVLVSIVFMEVGHSGKRLGISKKQSTLLFVAAFSVWLYCVVEQGIYIEIATRSYPYGILSIVIALCGCLCVVYLSHLLEAAKISRPIKFVGRHSLLLLLVHEMDFLYVDHLFRVLSNIFTGMSSNHLSFGIARTIADILVVCLLAALRHLPEALVAKSTTPPPRK